MLVLSSHENREYIVQALRAGADGYLLKSTLAENLEQAIWSVYQGDLPIKSKLLKKVLTSDPIKGSAVHADKSFVSSRGNRPTDCFTAPPLGARERGSFTKVAPAQPRASVKQNGSSFKDKQTAPKIALDLNGNSDDSVDFSDQYLKNADKSSSKISKTKQKPLAKHPESKKNSYDHTFQERLLIFSQSKSFGLIILGLLVASATIFYSLNFAHRKTTTTSTKETLEPVVDSVTALGRIEPAGEVITLSPPPNIGGTRIKELMVVEGEQVKEDQVIALLDNHGLKKAAVETAQQEVEVAQVDLAITKAGAKTGDIEAQKAVIKRLEAELAGKIKTQSANLARLEAQLLRETEAQTANLGRSRAELKDARAQFQRYQKLAQDGAISISELDSRRLNLETAQERVKEAEANYNRTKDTLQEEIREAQASTEETQNTIKQQIEEAQASLASVSEVRPLDVQKATAELGKAIADLQQAQQDLELTYVKAPIAGQVLRINARPGEMVTQNEGVVELAQTSPMVVVAEIYETDIRHVSLGQQAEIISEGGAFDDEIRGEVTYIRSQIGNKDIFDTDPAADVDTRVIEVKITLDSTSSQKVSQFTNSKVIVKINRN